MEELDVNLAYQPLTNEPLHVQQTVSNEQKESCQSVSGTVP